MGPDDIFLLTPEIVRIQSFCACDVHHAEKLLSPISFPCFVSILADSFSL